MSARFDIAVIGAGIAGASMAAECAGVASVALLEAEPAPGYHTTGRSAAFWEECFGGPAIVPLTLASEQYLASIGALRRRGAVYIARTGDEAAVETFLARFHDTGVRIERLDRDALERLVPGLRQDWTLAVSEPRCADIDVTKVHHHYLSLLTARGGRLLRNHRVANVERNGSEWLLDCGAAGEMRAGVLVDAAGAWADDVARMAGARPLDIAPLRRTIVQLRTDPTPPADLPLVLDLDGKFYFKPEAARLWLSPHDETPSPPCDAAPEEIDVALAIDRLQQVVDWRVEAVERKWAGLRSFAPDRRPVYGWDRACEGFFWFAGQGGFGIQTAPPAARLAAQLLFDRPRDRLTETLDAALYAASRFVPRVRHAQDRVG